MADTYGFNKHVKEVRSLDLESASTGNIHSMLCSTMSFTSPII